MKRPCSSERVERPPQPRLLAGASATSASAAIQFAARIATSIAISPVGAELDRVAAIQSLELSAELVEVAPLVRERDTPPPAAAGAGSARAPTAP